MDNLNLNLKNAKNRFQQEVENLNIDKQVKKAIDSGKEPFYLKKDDLFFIDESDNIKNKKPFLFCFFAVGIILLSTFFFF